MATAKITPAPLEGFAADLKINSYRRSAVVRGWQAVTPDVISVVRAEDEKRIAALTAHYIAKHAG